MSTESKTPVTHVIFDFDGTIVNSVDIYIKVLRDYAISRGKELSPEVESNYLRKYKIYGIFN